MIKNWSNKTTSEISWQSVLERYWRVLFALPFIISLFLSLYGIDHGLPFVYDPDEPTFVTAAGGILANRDLNPHWFGHPGSTVIYLLAALYAGLFILGYLTGNFTSPEDFRILYHQDPTLLYLSGRLLMVIFNLLVLWMAMKIAQKIFNKKVALTSGILIAVSPILIEFSQLIRTDLLATFLILCCFWYCVKILENNSITNYIAAGFLAGFAVTTKYPSIWITFSIFLAHIISKPRRKISLLLVSAVSCLAGCFLSSPYLLLDYSTAIKDIFIEARSYHLSHAGNGFIWNLAWYISNPLLEQLTLLGIAFLISGVLISVWQKKNNQFMLVSFPVVFLVFISSLSLIWERWLIPIIPFAMIIVASAIVYFSNYSMNKTDPVKSELFYVSILLITAMPLLMNSLESSSRLAGEDTRTMAANWMMQNIPQSTSILSERYAPILPKDQFTFYTVNEQGLLIKFNSDDTYKNIFSPSGHIGQISDWTQIIASNIEYVVLSHMYTRYLEERDKYPTIIQAYEEIMRSGELVFISSPKSWQINGPEIRIYRISN